MDRSDITDVTQLAVGHLESYGRRDLETDLVVHLISEQYGQVFEGVLENNIITETVIMFRRTQIPFMFIGWEWFPIGIKFFGDERVRARPFSGRPGVQACWRTQRGGDMCYPELHKPYGPITWEKEPPKWAMTYIGKLLWKSSYNDEIFKRWSKLYVENRRAKGWQIDTRF